MKKNLKEMNSIVFLLFFYLNFTFTLKKISTLNTVLIYLGCIIYIALNWKILKNYINKITLKKIVILSIPLLISLVAAVIIPIVYKTYDFAYLETLTSIFRGGLKFLCVLVCFKKHHGEKANLELFTKYYLYTCVLYCITTVIFLIPGLKEFWNGVIYDKDYSVILKNKNYITRYGVAGYSGFQVAFKFAFAMTLNIYTIIKNKCIINKKSLWMIITYLFIMLGSFFYGRIGSVVCIINNMFLLIYVLRNIKSCKKVVLIVMGILLSITLLLVILYNINDNVKMWSDWAFAPVINLFKTGKLYTGSSDIVFDRMIFMPKIKTFFFGDGYYKNYYMSTDVGFMRPILFYGVIFTIFGYLTALLPLYYITKFTFKKDKNITLLALMWLITLVIFEIKGEIFYRIVPLILIFYAIILEEYSDSKGKE